MNLGFSKTKPSSNEIQLRPKKYRRFNFLFSTTAVVPLLSIGVFNIVINPYGAFNTPQLPGINQVQPAKLNNTRLFKAVDVTRIKPVTVFLGSSRTDYGLDPEHPVLKDYQPAYNLALGAATPYEMLQYLQHALANQQELKLVIINVDEFMFNSLNQENPSFSEHRLRLRRISVRDFISTTFSLDALWASKDNIALSKVNPEYRSYQLNGMLNLRPIDQDQSATNYRFRNSIGFYFKSFPGEYELSEKHLKDFQALIELCRQNNISVKVFISPSHATRWEAIRAAGHWPMYENMKRELAQITPIWDFSGYNSITTEPISNKITNYIDDSHYRKEVGDLVLNRIFSYSPEQVPEDFGVLLNSENIESHLGQIRSDRENWAQRNPQEVSLVEEIKAEITDQAPQ